MTKKVASPSSAVTITRPWQLAFLFSAVASQLSATAYIVWAFSRSGSWVSASTWTYQIVYFTYPLLFVAAALLFLRRRVSGTLPRLFWASFLATIGCFASMVITTGVQAIQTSWLRDHYYGADASIWNSFSWQWTGMGAAFALYCGSLAYVAWRVKRPR
jgi:hypothetical protein